MKLIAIMLGMVMLVSLVSALGISNHPIGIDNPDRTISPPIEVKPRIETPTNPQPSSSSNTVTGSKSSTLVTRWVHDGIECRKADVLSKPFIISKNSLFMLPHLQVGTTPSGDKVMQRIFSGKNGIVIDFNTRKVIKEPTCLQSTENALLDWDWFKEFK